MKFYHKAIIGVSALLIVLAGIIFGSLFVVDSAMNKMASEAQVENDKWSAVADKVNNDHAFTAISNKLIMTKEADQYTSSTSSFKANIPGGFIGNLITSIPSVHHTLSVLEEGDKLAADRASNDTMTKAHAQEEAQRFCLITSSASDNGSSSVTEEQKQELFTSKSMLTNFSAYREYCASKTAAS